MAGISVLVGVFVARDDGRSLPEVLVVLYSTKSSQRSV